MGVRNTALFAHTPGVRAPLSSTQRASFSVRRDPSTYSPAAFTERWNEVPSRDDGSAEPCLQVGWRCMIPASDEAGARSKEESFGERLAKLVTDDLSRPRPRNFANEVDAARHFVGRHISHGHGRREKNASRETQIVSPKPVRIASPGSASRDHTYNDASQITDGASVRIH